MEQTASVTMYGRTTELDVADASVLVQLARVIRGAGPREGDTIGWAAVELAADLSDAEIRVYPTRAEAEAECRTRSAP